MERRSVVASQISVDGVAYDVSNLLMESKDVRIMDKIYPKNFVTSPIDGGFPSCSHPQKYLHSRNQSLLSPVDNDPQRSRLVSAVTRQSPTSDPFLLKDDAKAVLERLEMLSTRSDSSDNREDRNVRRNCVMKTNLPNSTKSISPNSETASLKSMQKSSQIITKNNDTMFFEDPKSASWSQITTPRHASVVERHNEQNQSPIMAKIAKSSKHDYQCDDDSDEGSMIMESLMIEIAPGLSECVRGSAETIKAHRNGNLVVVHCVCCDQDISCVGDAAYVLCPTCSVVSPIPEESLNGNASWGVGLGFVPA